MTTVSSVNRLFKTLIACGCLAGSGLSISQGATPIFFDDFQEYSGRITSTQGAGEWTSNLPDTGANYFEVVQDGGNRFGQGTDNKVLHFHVETNAGAALRLQDVIPGGDVITVSLMLYQSPASVRSLDLRTGVANIGGANIAQRLTMGNGQITGGGTASFPVGEAIRIDMIINNSSNALVDYYTGSGTLDSQRAAIWVDGVLQGNNLFQGVGIAPGTNLTSFAIQTLSGTTATADLFLDWVAVYNGAEVMSSIPEPHTSVAVIGGLFALFWIYGSRRSKRRTCL